MAVKLSQKTVDAALYEGRSYMSKSGRKRWSQHILWDEELPGFGLRITSTNRKSFIVSYRAGGRKRTRTVGRADRMTLDEARAQAAELLASVADAAPRTADRPRELEGVETVAQLADAYLEIHLKPNLPSCFREQRLIRTHIKPAMGRSRIAEVTPIDVASLGRRVGRRFPADAPRLRKLLGDMFDWAADQGLRSRTGRRNVSAELPLPKLSGARPKAPAEPAAVEPPSIEELQESLARSEEQRLELEQRLEEVSSSGSEMLVKLNEQAAAQKELEAELARAQRHLDRARRSAADPPVPEETERQLANLQQSVEQLMTSLGAAERDRQELAEKLAETEARAGNQSRRLTRVTRARNELEEKMREMERQAAMRKVQGRPGVGRLQAASWLAAGAVAGVALVLLLQAATGRREGSPPLPERRAAAPAEAVPGSAATEPTADAGRSGVSAGRSGVTAGPPSAPSASTPAAEPAAAVTGPDPAAVEAAVRSWATAWSDQRVDDYLAAYSTGFVPPDGQSRAAWASQRRSRIRRPASIRVMLAGLTQTIIEPDRVRVSFEQRYETPTYADRVTKILELAREAGGWKIVTERAE